MCGRSRRRRRKRGGGGVCLPLPYFSIAASSDIPTVPSSKGVNTVVAMFWIGGTCASAWASESMCERDKVFVYI